MVGKERDTEIWGKERDKQTEKCKRHPHLQPL